MSVGGNCGGESKWNNADTLVNLHIDGISKKADESFNQAMELLDALQDFKIAPVDRSGVLGSIGSGSLSAFALPEKPEFPEFSELEIADLPNDPDFDNVSLNLDRLPSRNLTPPTLSDISKPAPLNVDAPVKDYTLAEVVIPSPPTVTLPEVPNLLDIRVPTAPTLNLQYYIDQINALRNDPRFERPDLDTDMVQPFLTHFDSIRNTLKTEADALLFANVKDRIDTMLLGGTGLPAAIEQALFDRAADREDRIALQATQQATEEWSAKGFTLPGGVLTARIDAVQQANREAKAQHNREVLIKAAEWEIENLRFAVQQGITLEGQRLNLYTSVWQLSGEIAGRVLDAMLAEINAKIEAYKADILMFQALAQVLGQAIQAELSKLEKFKLELEGQQLIGQLNLQRLEEYKARLSGVLSTIEIYKGELEGAKITAETNLQVVRGFAEEVNAYAAQVGAKNMEWEGFVAETRAQQNQIAVFDSQVRAYATEIQAVSSRNDAKATEARAKADNNRAKIELLRARLDHHRSGLDAQISVNNNKAQQYDSLSRMYIADTNANSSHYEAQARQFSLSLEKARIEGDLNLKDAQISIEESQRSTSMALELVRAQAHVASQLAASAMAAVNVGASISNSASSSESIGCSTSYTIDSSPA